MWSFCDGVEGRGEEWRALSVNDENVLRGSLSKGQSACVISRRVSENVVDWT